MLTPKKKDTGVVVTKDKRDAKGIAAERAKGNTVYIPKRSGLSAAETLDIEQKKYGGKVAAKKMAMGGATAKKAMPKKAMGGKMAKKMR
jgi:hypothetical protein